MKAALRNVRDSIRHRLLYRKWLRAGMEDPPPHRAKVKIVQEYATRFSIQTLVETGTYLGDMVYANKHRFQTIISIELDRALYERAKERFRRYPHVRIVHGDSGTVLPMVLKTVVGSCLFWLDGHYSGSGTAKGSSETPILNELLHIKSHGDDHVILIDDARLFQGTNDYPALDELRSFSQGLWQRSTFDVQYDIIRICPARPVPQGTIV